MYPLHNVALTVYTIITNKFDVDWKTTSPKSIFAPPKTFILEFLNECFRYCFSGIGLRVYTTIESPHSPDKYPKIHRISIWNWTLSVPLTIQYNTFGIFLGTLKTCSSHPRVLIHPCSIYFFLHTNMTWVGFWQGARVN